MRTTEAAFIRAAVIVTSVIPVIAGLGCGALATGVPVPTNQDGAGPPAPAGGGTGGMSNPPGNTAISFARDVQPIFNANCVGCHSPGGGANVFSGIRMILTPAQSYGSLVNQMSSQRSTLTLVVPGNPAASLLWLKVSSSSPPVGSRMPLIGGPLTSSQIDTIQNWILEGAPNN